MKNVSYLLILIILFSSCYKSKSEYPKYSLTTISEVPDSLKSQQREWIKETIRAASQHMIGGDYEDVDETIDQAKRTSDQLFYIDYLSLRKEVDENVYRDIIIKPKDMNTYEKKVFDSLINKK